MSEEQLVIAPSQAEGLLLDGPYIHTMRNPAGGMFLWCDMDRADAIAAMNAAVQIEIGGPGCRAMRHPIAVWHSKNDLTFFEADMQKLEAFEIAKAEQVQG